MAKSQREVAKTFRAEAVAIKQDMAKMVANSDALRGRVAGFQKDLATAKKNGDPAAVKTMQGLLDRINERIASNEAGVKALQPTADRFDAKASEWEALADETLSTLKEDKKVKQSGLTNGSIYISHYGIKGQKWGVRRTREQLARLAGPRVAERRASKEARGMDEATLQKKIKRLQMEKQYSELVKSQTARDQTAVEDGSLRVADVIYKSGTQAVGTVAGTIVAYGMIEGINKYAGTSIKNKKKSG